MRIKFLFIYFFFGILCLSNGQAPTIQWQHSLGGTDADEGKAVCNTHDGNIVVAGEASSYDGDVTCHQGNFDIWIVKLDIAGGVIWQNCFGGIGVERVYSIEQTSDDGFIIAGSSDLNSGIVSGVHGNEDDFWIVKTDSLGVFQWQKCYGGTNREDASDIHQTSDGGYIVVGSATSDDGDVTGHHGFGNGVEDIWVLKLDTLGNLQWQKTFGGTDYDFGYSIHQTRDGGFIIAGFTLSLDGDITNINGLSDAWIIKTDSVGNIQRQKCYGGSLEDAATSIQQTSDGGYIFVGETRSTDGDVVASHLGDEVWLVKINSLGVIQWQKTLGGNADEYAFSVQITNDHGFFIVGDVNSNDGDVSGNHGFGDYWAVKTDSSGNIEWQMCLGGTDVELSGKGIQTADSGYIVVGTSLSNDGDVSGHHFPFQGNEDDYWIVKLSPINTSIATPTSPLLDFTTYLTNNNLYLNFYANGNEKTVVQLLDITGRVLLQQGLAVTAGFNKQEVKTGEVSAGVYMVRVVTEGGAVTKKVLSIGH